ncbi:helix-turn-helix domain-containing protein, partial [Mycolicibacterium sp.]|uniref:TetR/AcrR family transcriptional regulator n=1 Tax=Mycolicibacterium sp. TaxID=2320850 RepID=UPI0025F84120
MADRQRAQRAELVREEVIDAALAEFAERGYHQTSISHIAKRLGSGHSMFYRYFENKRYHDHAGRAHPFVLHEEGVAIFRVGLGQFDHAGRAHPFVLHEEGVAIFRVGLGQ